MQSMQDVLVQALSVAMLGIATAFGVAFKAWIDKRLQKKSDLAVATEKIRALRLQLGLNEPIEPKSIDDIFTEIRRLSKTVDERKSL